MDMQPDDHRIIATTEGPLTIVRAFIALDEERKAMEDRVEETKRALRTMKEQVKGIFLQNDIPSLPIGEHLAYLHRSAFISYEKGKGSDDLVCALRKAGLEQYIIPERADLEELAKLGKECEEHGSSLTIEYPALDGVVKLQGKIDVRTRRTTPQKGGPRIHTNGKTREEE